jgi:hypothetical protein
VKPLLFVYNDSFGCGFIRRAVMLTRSEKKPTWYVSGAPMNCVGCGQPFPREGNHVRCLHTEHGYFCDEFCEADHLIAKVAQSRGAS